MVFLLYLFDHNYITQLFSWEVEVGSNFVFQHGFDFFLPLSRPKTWLLLVFTS